MLGHLRQTLSDIAAQPPDAPMGLPGWAYTDTGVWQAEQAMLRRGIEEDPDHPELASTLEALKN